MGSPELPVAERWFQVEEVGDGVVLITEPHADPYIRSNIWYVRGRKRDLLVDTGNGIGRLRPVVEELAEHRPVIAVVTHAHFDHMGGLHEFEVRFAHEADEPEIAWVSDPLCLRGSDLSEAFLADMAFYGSEVPEVMLDALPEDGFEVAGFRTSPAVLSRTLADGDGVDLGDRVFEVLHLPGHTPGSIGLWDEARGMLLTGDTAYVDDALQAEDEAAFLNSLERLRRLEVWEVYPGHNRRFGREELHALVDDRLSAAGA
jgi:glyoxylase-like metal-dependent hydrolase (beta-lactamase superfamily II)